ncbi:GNAT family N-acetyltransferase [Kitasatospora sp. NPDC051853]|uniref:GNAT family N-acetyltransferase n=1 Tax=Kitasatospora sp. NPDC051853 TaxID=3364058 RepID=UPI0037907609
METARWWVEGWAVSRRLAAPVDVPWGMRIDVGGPRETVRHVLLGADATTARTLIASVAQPAVCIKGFLPAEVMDPWFPAADWQPVDPCFLMAVDLRPSRTRVPDGYTVTTATTGGVTTVRVLADDGSPAASGQAGLTTAVCVPDRISTEPAHQRRGLGTVVMAALTDAALAHGVSSGVLGATVQGRALYETLGWRALAPLTGYVSRGR